MPLRVGRVHVPHCVRTKPSSNTRARTECPDCGSFVRQNFPTNQLTHAQLCSRPRAVIIAVVNGVAVVSGGLIHEFTDAVASIERREVSAA